MVLGFTEADYKKFSEIEKNIGKGGSSSDGGKLAWSNPEEYALYHTDQISKRTKQIEENYGPKKKAENDQVLLDFLAKNPEYAKAMALLWGEGSRKLHNDRDNFRKKHPYAAWAENVFWDYKDKWANGWAVGWGLAGLFGLGLPGIIIGLIGKGIEKYLIPKSRRRREENLSYKALLYEAASTAKPKDGGGGQQPQGGGLSPEYMKMIIDNQNNKINQLNTLLGIVMNRNYGQQAANAPQGYAPVGVGGP